MKNINVSLKIDAKTGTVQFEIDKLKKQLDKMGESGKKAGKKTADGLNQADQSGKKLNKTVSFIKTRLGALAAIAFGSKIAAEFVKAGDAVKSINAKLNLVTDSTDEYNLAQQEVFRIAQETRQALGSTVDLYTRMERALAGQNIAQKQVLQVTETVNQALAVSGATAQEASSVITQLSQGLAAGALRGEEFNSVNESGSRIMQALKDELGKTSGELREMAFAGQLTTEVITDALKNQSAAIGNEFGKLPLTVSGAFQQLSNANTKFLGELDQDVGITDKLAASMGYLAENIDAVYAVLAKIVTVATIVAGGTGLQAIAKGLGGLTISLNTATIAAGRLGAAMKAALLANPYTTGLLALYAAYEGVNYLIDEHNEKIKEMSRLTGDAKKAKEALHQEMAKGFDEANIEVYTQSIKTLETELSKLLAEQKKLNDERERENDLILEFAGTAQERRMMAAGVATRGTSDEQKANQNKIEATQAALGLARANEFLTETFKPLFKAAQEQMELDSQAKQVAAEQTSAVNEFLEKSQERLEKLKLENQLYGKTAKQVLVLNAAKIKQGIADKERLREIDALVVALGAELEIKEQLVSAEENAKTLIKESIETYKERQGLIEQIAQSLETSAERTNRVTDEHIALLREEQSQLFISQERYDNLELMIQKLNQKREQEIVTIDDLIDKYDEQIQALTGGGDALLEHQAKLELEQAGIEATEKNIEKLVGKYKELADVKKVDLSEMFDGFAQGLNPVISSLQSFKDEIEKINELANSGYLNAGQQAFYSTGVAAEFALNSMASMAQEGSDAQKKLQAAAAITNTVLGISAILEQGKGDPYTAFARMAAMAAMVASMGVQVAGAFGGSGGGGAEHQQAIQGTGTVLGDASAKSESIENSLNLIADASEKIVGINSKMLRSLTSMSDAISGTVTEIGKLGTIGDLGTHVSGVGGLTGAIDRLVFGGSKIRDRGIEVLSGSISQAINGDLFRAYEVARRRGLFGSRTRTNTASLESGIANQIGLIFQSMTDTILSGAEALGVNMTDVQNALGTYQIEEQRISLMDLSPDEQRAELEAVFSSIFDGLVGSSMPFISQFQAAGEGLGETISRVATTVLVFEEAIGSMGLDFIAKELDPELFAQSAVAISDFAGGMDKFIDGYTAYVSKFLSEEEQMSIMTDRISDIFAGLGLTLPETRDGFTQLIQGLDLTTATGQEAFGTLIALSGQMDSYYTNLEESQQRAIESQQRAIEALGNYIDFNKGIQDQIDDFSLSDFQRSMRDIERQYAANVSSLDELAEAAGMAGASEEDLARINELAALRTQKAIAALKKATEDLITQLYGEEAQAAVADHASAQQSAISQTANAGNNMFKQWESAIGRIRSYTESLLTDSRLSPLEADDLLAEAERQYYDAVAAANAGDVEAAQNIPNLLQEYLTILRDVRASGDDYNSDYYAAINAANAINVPDGLSNSVQVSPSASQIAYDEQQYRRNQEQLAQHRLELATALAEHVAELSQAINEPVLQLLEDMGVDVNEFLQDLGINMQDATSETVAQLAALAQTFGIEVTELADSVGLSLGSLADAQSLLNDGLEQTISSLPGGIQTQLSPLLRAVETAADGTEQEQALAELEQATAGLPAEYRNLLAPYFDNIDPTSELTQQFNELRSHTAYLRQIEVNTASSSGGTNNSSTPATTSIPSYDVGTPFVPQDQLAMVHKGEMIIPAKYANVMRSQTSENAGQLTHAISRMSEQIQQLQQDNRRTNQILTNINENAREIGNNTNQMNDNIGQVANNNNAPIRRGGRCGG